MNPYHQIVSDHERIIREGKSYPLANFPRCPRPQVAPDAPKVLIFAPHPDDEVVIGGLALRLLRQSKWNVLNVAVTHGSNPLRRAERLKELKACCECIGFQLIQTAPEGLSEINSHTRERNPAAWESSVKVVAAILAQQQPRVILFPHEADWNSTHIGTHWLVIDALKSLPQNFICYTVETEFWGAMTSPNLVVEIGLQDLGDLVTALTYHVGEVKRNPYHLTLPAWMVDNVRRGTELVGGQGKSTPDFTFATLYRARRWQNGQLENVYSTGRFLRGIENPASLFV